LTVAALTGDRSDLNMDLAPATGISTHATSNASPPSVPGHEKGRAR